MSERRPRARRVAPSVIVLGVASLLNDISSEMIFPLLPVFITSTLGASEVALGLIEGSAESVAAIFKLYFGRLSDRLGRRKELVVVGYALSALAKPCLALSGSIAQVLGLRASDRFGKGMRTAPRDALIAAACTPETVGRNFGFHRAMDNLGALIGPALGFLVLKRIPGDYRRLFVIAGIPGLLAPMMLLAMVREKDETRALARRQNDLVTDLRALSGRLRTFLLAVFIFTLGNSSDAFILLRLRDLGVAPLYLPILWALHNLSRASSAYPAGALSDRLGRRPLVIGGWAIYAAVYLGFGLSRGPLSGALLLVIYGLYFGLCEGVERAAIVDLCPPEQRGGVLGLYHFMVGLGALPASLILGALWDTLGPRVAFSFGAALAAIAAAIAFPVLPARQAKRTE